MAARYWVGGHPTNNNWNQTGSGTTNWSATSGGAAGASVPTSTDDVTFDSSGNSNSTISATITILSLTITSGYTSTITHNAVLTISGSVTFGANYTIAGSSSITINSASTITSNGKTWPNSVTFAAGAKTISGDWTVSGTLTTTSTQSVNLTTSERINVGGLAVNSILNGSCNFYLKSGTWSGTNVNGASVPMFFDGNVTVSGNVYRQTGTLTYVSGTITTSGSTLNFNGAAATLDTNGIVWNDVTTNNNTQFTLDSLFSASGTFSSTAGTSVTFQGSAGFSIGTFSIPATVAFTVTLKESLTYIITSSIVCFTSRIGAIVLFTSASAITKTILILSKGATCQCLANFTRIDASGGRPVRSFNGTITDCVNVVSITDLKTVAG